MSAPASVGASVAGSSAAASGGGASAPVAGREGLCREGNDTASPPISPSRAARSQMSGQCGRRLSVHVPSALADATTGGRRRHGASEATSPPPDCVAAGGAAGSSVGACARKAMRSVRLCSTGAVEGPPLPWSPCCPPTPPATRPVATAAEALVVACAKTPATERRAAVAVRCASPEKPSPTRLRRRLKLASVPPLESTALGTVAAAAAGASVSRGALVSWAGPASAVSAAARWALSSTEPIGSTASTAAAASSAETCCQAEEGCASSSSESSGRS